jgi:hypothetical protein
MSSEPQYETILNFGQSREHVIDKDVPIEEMQNTYIPKSEHLARLKFYRLENLKSQYTQNQKSSHNPLNLRIGGLQHNLQEYLKMYKYRQIKEQKRLKNNEY